MDRRDIGSWLPGRQRLPILNLPPAGPGSLAPMGRRLLALLIDWFACGLVARLFVHVPLVPSGPSDPNWSAYWSAAIQVQFVQLGVFFIETTILLFLLGGSFGQVLMGLRFRRLDGGRIGLIPAIARQLLLCLVIPALVMDGDSRGLHDRAAQGVLIRV